MGGDRSRPQQRVEGVPHRPLPQQIPGDPCDIARFVVDHRGQAGQRTTAVGALPADGNGDRTGPLRQPGEHIDGRRRRCGGRGLGLDHLVATRWRPEVLTQRLGQPVVEGPELQEVEQFPQLLGVGHRVAEVVEPHRQLDISNQLHQPDVAPGLVLVLLQVLAELGRLLGGVGEDPVEVAVSVDQLRRRLLAHAGDTGQVVRGVPPEGCVLHVLARLHPGPLDDSGLVVEGVVRDAALVVEDLDVGVLHQLVGIPVAGDDDDVVTPVTGVGGQRGDDVISLDPRHVDRGHPEGVHHLAHQRHLLTQDVGCRLPLGLVLGVLPMPERRFWPVEGHRHRIGPVVAHQVDEHRREPVHGVGDLT